MTTTHDTPPVTVESLLGLARDAAAQAALPNSEVQSDHLVSIARLYNQLAGLLVVYPSSALDIAEAAGVLVQARSMPATHGGQKALRLASTLTDIAVTASWASRRDGENRRAS